MRVLILTWRDLAHPAAGGAEVYTEQVARRWVAAGHEVTVFASAVEGRPAEEVVDGYTVVRRGSRLSVYRSARRWYRDHGRGQYDLVIDMVNTVPFLAHRWIDDTPVVAFFHQTAEECWHFNAPMPVAYLGRYVLEPRWIKAYRDRPVLTVSESSAEALRRFGVRNITVLPEGFEPVAAPAVAKEGRPTAVWCARLVPYKRPQDLVEAARRLESVVPDLQVWIMGGGPMLDELRASAPANVEVLGRVSDEEKVSRMARAHVHVATSQREGWGLVVSEAAAVGTPTVAYDSPGLRDSTRAAGGVLCAPDPAHLAHALSAALHRWTTEDFAPVPFGGAESWDTVADAMLAAVTPHVAAPRVSVGA